MTVQLNNVQVLDNPAPFTADFKFLITFDCVEPGLKEELEWKLIYVGSADCEQNDQELDSILVGPAPAPDPTKIPEADLLDVTVVLLTCSYKEQEFIRIGYYVHNEYEEEIDPKSNKINIIPQKITRNILADKPRVTRFGIAWDGEEESKQNEQQETECQDDEMVEENEEEKEQEDDEEEEDDDDEEDEESTDAEEDLDATEEADRVGKKSKKTQMKDGNETDQDIDMQ